MDDPAAVPAANAESLAELRALIGQLRDEDFALPLGHGWTVASALGHVGFWEMRAAVMADRWKLADAASGVNIDDEGVNEALEPVLRALSGPAIGVMAVAAAAAATIAINRLSPRLVAEALQPGAPFFARRADHRREHIAQIEQALAERRAR